MKALVLSEHGDLDKLGLVKDKPVPQPGDGEVLVRVGASSFNYHDIFTVRGMPGIRVPLPVVIGLDIAGTVVEDATAFFLLVIVTKLLEGQFVFAPRRVTVTSPKTPPTYRNNLYYLPKKKKCCYLVSSRNICI